MNMVKIQSFDPRITLSIIRSKKIDPKKWDKIQHMSRGKIVLHRYDKEGNLEIKTIHE